MSGPIPKPKVRKMGERRRGLQARYSSLRYLYLSKHRYCEARIACDEVVQDRHGKRTIRALATDIHHKRGRGRYYLDTTTWLAVCRACHMHIEAFPLEAYEHGWSERKVGEDG